MPDHAGHGTVGDELGEWGHLLDLVESTRPVWHADAACREAPLEVSWFPARGEPVAAAKLICRGCLVAEECRAWALAQGPELDGLWGGLSRRERAVERRGMAA